MDKGEELLWTTTASVVERMIGIEISGDEACMVLVDNDDEDSKAFSGTYDVDR